jgi:hypothetical protein
MATGQTGFDLEEASTIPTESVAEHVRLVPMVRPPTVALGVLAGPHLGNETVPHSGQLGICTRCRTDGLINTQCNNCNDGNQKYTQIDISRYAEAIPGLEPSVHGHPSDTDHMNKVQLVNIN